ncbi:MAG: heavy metal translocating P-type ATPase metal-binding domain-containing protein [Steroidobacteraceae bacterium]
MNAHTLPAAAATGTPAAAAAAAGCFHCGDELPRAPVRALMQNGTESFCCAGCAAAAQWIHSARLDDYYLLRSASSMRVAAEPADLGIWDREDVIAPHVRNVPQGREIVLLTDGMRCAACAWLIDRALAREAGVSGICANAVTGRIRLVWNPALNRLSVILGRLQSLGYRPYLASDLATETARRRERNGWLLRLGLAGIATLQAMMFAEALYLDTAHQMPLPTRDFFRWLTFLLATPVVFYAGFPFLAGAWHELRQRRAGMDVLVSASVLLAWGASTVETMRGGAQVWFDAAVMFVFLLLAARMLEQGARRLSTERIDTLARLRPVLAQQELDGSMREVTVTQLQCGDIIRVPAGEHVPADATLLTADAAFDESLLTGEAREVWRRPGDAVLAGSLCRTQPLRLQVTAAGSATRLSALTRLVLQAQECRPAAARTADRIASWFVLGLVGLAVVAYFYWRTTEPARAFEVALAILVISCPCALSLSVPAALAAAYSRLSALGVLVVRPDALQTLASVDTIVFDKTGTLGDGQWQIEQVTAFDDLDPNAALQMAAALEGDALHPIASAFRPHAGPRTASQVRNQAGGGIEGCIDGKLLRIGTARFAADRQDDGAIWLGTGARALARFTLREQPRPESSGTLLRLRNMGLRLQVLSGDASSAVQDFVSRLGVPLEVSAGRLLPEDKLARIRALQQQGRKVAMVGDGINDAPVLGGADVPIAVSGGAALARQSADLVLLNPSLQRVGDAIELARRTRRIVRQNLGWAMGYNLVAVPIAAMGYIPPWAAAFAMVVSSLTVTLNALRLARGRQT